MNPTKYAITTTSKYAAELLNRPAHGTVHSVYRKTINLSFGGRLLALQAAGSPLSPISLITGLSPEDMELLPISAGDIAEIRNQAITINESVCFPFGPACVQDLKLLKTLDSVQIDILERQILIALSAQNAGSFELLFTAPGRAKDILFLSAAEKRLSDTEYCIRTNDFQGASSILRGLIGLGLGLTPGGDDFLCGVLAGLFLCGLTPHPFTRLLQKEINEHLADTNEISAAFLSCALANQFSLAVNSLCSLPSGKELLSTFREIGHSSGTDTLCGVYYAFHIRHSLEI